MPSAKRSKVDIYRDVLDLLCQEAAQFGKASSTRVARRANLPYDRFQKILEHFIKLNMVKRTDDGLLITEIGLDCLCQINRTNEFLGRIGLDI
jgi:predicted transcriptional regulator